MALIDRNDTVFIPIDFQERLVPAMCNKEDVVDKGCRLAEGMKILGIPVIVTRQYPKGIGDTIPEIKEAVGEHEPADKSTFGCMFCEDFCRKLKEVGRKTAVVTGMEAHICVQQTVLQLLDAGYQVDVPVDCIGSRTERDMMWAAERMERAGAILTTYEAVLYELMQDSKIPEFKAISKIVK